MRLLIAVICLSNFAFSQGPVDGFFKGKGNLDIALSGAYQHSEKFYDGQGIFNYQRRLTSVSLFGEYGLTEDLDAIFNIPFINGQFQDASFFVKTRISWALKHGVISVVPAAGVSFPMSNYETEASQSIGQRATQIQPKLVFQFDVNGGYFFQLQSGYNYAFSPVPSSLPISAKIGLYRKKIYTDMWFDYQRGIGGAAWHVDPISSFRELFVTYAKVGGVFFYSLRPKFGIFVNGSYILSGINIGKAYSIGAGLVYKFDLIK